MQKKKKKRWSQGSYKWKEAYSCKLFQEYSRERMNQV